MVFKKDFFLNQVFFVKTILLKYQSSKLWGITSECFKVLFVQWDQNYKPLVMKERFKDKPVFL